MVCNLIFGCIHPPEWMLKYKLDRRPHNVNKHRFFGYGTTQICTSLASDAAIASNWFYYIIWLSRNDRRVYSMALLTISVVLATITWFLQVVEGRLGFQQCCGLRLANQHVLGIGILLQDIPQIALTVLMDIFYQNGLSMAGLLNIATSLHDALTKIRALVDDDVEDERKYINSDSLLVERPGIKEAEVSRLAAEI